MIIEFEKALTFEENVRFYRGRSMGGTFRLGDRLIIRPVSWNEIQPGDVIVFTDANHRDGTDEIVHRVVRVTGDGLFTRGDNNPACDIGIVRPDQVISKVESIANGKQKLKVLGGLKGLYLARVRWEFSQFYRWVRKLIGQPYRLLRLSGIVPKIWKPEIDRIYLHTEHGPLVKYLYKQQSIGVWDPSHQRFECRKPFDLVIPSPLDKGTSS
jgi:signal peptidase I